MNLNLTVQSGNSIVCQVVPTPTQTINIDRGVTGNGISSIVPVTIGTFQYLQITYTNGTVVDVGPLTSTVYTATSPIVISGNTISLSTVQPQQGGTGVAGTLTGYVYGHATGAMTASITIPTTALSGTITNSQLANNSVTFNGVTVALGGSGTIPSTLANSLTLGTGLTGGSFNGSAAVTVNIANTGVFAGTYGSAAVVPVLTVNAQGQITSISTQPTNAPAYQGVWNAATNTPTLTSSVGTAGYYYVVSVAGNTTLNGVSGWNVGDWVIFENSVWQKLPGSTSESFTNLTTTNLAVTGLTGYMYANGSGNVTAATTIPNTGLANSSVTVNGVGIALGASGTITAQTPNALTIGTGLSGSTFNGSTAVTIANTGVLTFSGGTTGLTPNTATNGAITLAGTLAVANGGTGVTSSSGANSVVLRDANANITTNCLFEGYTSQAAGSLITLTAASVQNWTIAGSGGQTIKLPDATTLPNGATFTFNNNQSSGTIIVQNNSTTTVATIQSGSYITVVLLSNSIAAGSWDYHNSPPSNASWSTNTLNWAGSYTNGTWNGSVIGPVYGGTGVNNGSYTVTLGGNLSSAGAVSFAGAYPQTFTATQATSVTVPPSGYLISSVTNMAANPVTGTPSSTTFLRGDGTWATPGSSTGTVTSVSVVSANGFGGTVATSTTTPAITLTTSITGVLKGNGTAISAAVSGTDYAPPTSGSSILYGNGSGGFNNLTVGSGLSFSAGNLSNSSPMVYPGAGIPNSTGSVWGTSYSTTGSGTVLALATSPSLTTPILGTPQSGNFSTGTFTWPTFNQNTTGTAANITATSNSTLTTLSALSLPGSQISGNISGNAANVTGIVAIANGGTNSTATPTSGGVGYGTGTAHAYSTAGTSGQVLISGGASAPTWTTNIAGNAANVTGVVALANGGSGQTTAQTAMNTFAGAVTSAYYLRGNGTNVVMSAIQAADVPTLNQNTTGTAANITATSNATLTTLSALSLPGSQVSGNISGNAANVTGVVAIANGGTNSTATPTAGGVGYGTGTAHSYSVAGTSGQVLVSGGASSPTWTTNIAGNAANVTGTVVIANGGTGQTTAAAGFNALSPITTTGDLIVGNGTNSATRLPIGTTGQVLTSQGSGATPIWANSSSNGTAIGLVRAIAINCIFP